MVFGENMQNKEYFLAFPLKKKKKPGNLCKWCTAVNHRVFTASLFSHAKPPQPGAKN